jgi:membrane fusion protein (multidrug efflux system)
MSWYRERTAALLLAICPLLILLPACNNGGDKVALDNHTGAETGPAAEEAGIPVSRQLRSATVTTAPETIVYETVGSFRGWQEIVVSSEVDGKIAEIPVEIGQRVSKGALLARLVATDFQLDVQRAEAAKDMALADRENAKNEYERKQQLFEDNAIPRSTLDGFATRLAQAEANLRMAEASLGQMRHKLTKTKITAPANCTVGEKLVAEGEFLSMATGYEMIRLVVDRPMKLVFEVPEKLAVRIGTGQPVQARVAAFGDRLFEGTLHAVSAAASASTRTITVEARFDNADGELKSGFFASVSLSIPRGRELLMIPRDALQRDDIGASYVDVADGDGTRKALISIQGGEGDHYLVEGDLAVGDTVRYQ